MCPFQLRHYPLRGLDGHVVWSAHDYYWLNKVVGWGWGICEDEALQDRMEDADFAVSALIDNVCWGSPTGAPSNMVRQEEGFINTPNGEMLQISKM